MKDYWKRIKDFEQTKKKQLIIDEKNVRPYQ